jgi:hypothetical protein
MLLYVVVGFVHSLQYDSGWWFQQLSAKQKESTIIHLQLQKYIPHILNRKLPSNYQDPSSIDYGAKKVC